MTEQVEVPVEAVAVETVEETVTPEVEATNPVEEQDAVESPEAIETPTEPVVEEAAEELDQDAFNKLYFQMKQQERELDSLRKSTEDAAQKQFEAPLNKDAPVDAVPTLEQFDYDEEAYTAAMVDFKVNAGIEAAMKKQEDGVAEFNQQREQEAIAESFNTKAEDYATTNPDYQKVIDSYGEIVQYSVAVQSAILTAANGPALDYMLLKDPKLVEKLNRMPDHQAYMELGRLETLATAKAAAPKLSSAPAPIEDVNSGGTIATKDYVNENTSMDDYYAASQAAKLAKLQGK